MSEARLGGLERFISGATNPVAHRWYEFRGNVKVSVCEQKRPPICEQ